MIIAYFFERYLNFSLLKICIIESNLISEFIGFNLFLLIQKKDYCIFYYFLLDLVHSAFALKSVISQSPSCQKCNDISSKQLCLCKKLGFQLMLVSPQSSGFTTSLYFRQLTDQLHRKGGQILLRGQKEC